MNHKTWMQVCTGTVVAVALLLSAFSSAHAGRPTGPTPIEAEASGLAYNSTTNNHVPGDPDVAIGAAYAIAKANDQVEFIGRAADGTLQFPGDVMTDAAFWGTTAVDLTAGSGTATIVALRGDGRVYYEPYGPTGVECNPFGHFLVIELAELQVQINGTPTKVGGTVLAISDGEDPNPQGSWSIYAFYDQSAVCTNGIVGFTCPGDQPRLGFNTNWIAVWTDYEAGGGNSPLLFTATRRQCGKFFRPCFGAPTRQTILPSGARFSCII